MPAAPQGLSRINENSLKDSNISNLKNLTSTEPKSQASEDHGEAAESHRGAFGDFGGENKAFIERTFRERIVLVGMVQQRGASSTRETLNSLTELAGLVRTAGADPVEQVLARNAKPHPATFIGRGKLEELKAISERLDIDTVVFDDELTPTQQNNLGKILGRTAIDRTTVILDIFAQNATSQEGKVQVELAQLRHSLARLRRQPGNPHGLSQQAGGIGTRGPGETKLEVDRRSILRRTASLEKQLGSIAKRHQNQAKRRKNSELTQVALVGYTNAGKSTLLNALTGSEALIRNRFFSTLDATTRRLKLANNQEILLTDTVGFIRKLPHTLVEAFASTFAGVADADLILHIANAFSRDIDTQISEVRKVLSQIGADKIPELLVYNKADKVKMPASGNQSTPLTANHQNGSGVLAVSALTGQGLEELVQTIGHKLSPHTSQEFLVVPFGMGEVMADIHRCSKVLSREPTEGGMLFEVEISPSGKERFLEFVLGSDQLQL